jgi:predicted CopG family antitoxin
MTTIQVDKRTLKILQKIKEKKGLASYKEVIQFLLRQAIKPKESMFGVFGRCSREEILEGLRDEEDRI